MYIIGLTGGIACGKSTVTSILKNEGAIVIDADQIAHELMEYPRTMWFVIVDCFGREIVDEDNKINRKALGKIIFNDPDKRKMLNDITHKFIKDWINAKIGSLARSGEEIVVLDVPLLIEAGWHEDCDEVWVVTVPKDVQINRLMSRNNLSYDEAMARINSQMPLADKIEYASAVIDNGGEIKKTVQRVKSLWENAQGNL